jgi:hypothetical protein
VKSSDSRLPTARAALALGAIAAAVAALPDVKRVASGSGVSPGVAWLGLAGNTALVLGPLLVLALAAASRSRGLGAALLGIGLAALPLALLGEELKAHTHHRPLGAATFGALALCLLVLCTLLGVRFVAWVRAEPSLVRRTLVRFAAVVALLGTSLVLLRAVASESAHHDVIDVLRLLAATAIAWMGLNQPRVEMWARRAGALAWLALVVGGLVAARGPVRAAIHEHAPVLGGPAAWL